MTREELVEKMIASYPSDRLNRTFENIAEAMLSIVLENIDEVVEMKEFKHEYENKSIQDWYTKIVLKPSFRKE